MCRADPALALKKLIGLGAKKLRESAEERRKKLAGTRAEKGRYL